MWIQAHSLTERVHDIDLLSLDAQSVAEVLRYSRVYIIVVNCKLEKVAISAALPLKGREPRRSFTALKAHKDHRAQSKQNRTIRG